MADSKNISKIGAILSNTAAPLKARFRALFTLKGLGGKVAIDEITSNFKDDSSLLKHEMAYCLGQMQDDYALNVLRNLIEDSSQDTIVRHEAAEALGAIGKLEDLNLLEKYSVSPPVELAETCQLAVSRIHWLQKATEKELSEANLFNSVDPAPPFVDHSLSVEELTSQLLDEEASLFTRYRAMFTLRNMKTKESVLAICQGFKGSSVLFRHEVAYVLGQIAHEASETALTSSLANTSEVDIVRHECAEALGAIATPSCISTLQQFINDKHRIVRESCEVALDMAEYEMGNEFQYADALQAVV